MATIADVAKLAGLSRATVSRVINNHPYVTDKKKQLVYQAMKELEYYPNSSAQRLRKQKTDTIAVLVPNLTNPFFPFLIEGMEMIAVENHLQLLICQTQQDKDKELTFLNLLKTKQVDGLIFTAIKNDLETIASYQECGPIILCNEYQSEAKIPIIRLDQYKGSYMGTRFLIEKGHRNIAYCGGAEGELGADRQKGFMDAMKESRLEVDSKSMFRYPPSIDSGKKVLREILAMENKPTAIFAGSDEVAAGIVKEAKSFKLRIPEDIAVMGFDDLPIAELVEPSLTTIRQPVKGIGKKTMEIMISMLANPSTNIENQVYELPIELVIRESI
ncbi:LacI family DNA-binding transcriptional regulator [Halalkalibacter kiskunsagensis]|uniref:LacI family DNA-binding transcriptional regulator n=1 Tax=Halalkalibacter kiskunsagensis TaxID=1548599 RepID=A0ABV6KKZ6_9BACI